MLQAQFKARVRVAVGRHMHVHGRYHYAAISTILQMGGNGMPRVKPLKWDWTIGRDVHPMFVCSVRVITCACAGCSSSSFQDHDQDPAPPCYVYRRVTTARPGRAVEPHRYDRIEIGTDFTIHSAHTAIPIEEGGQCASVAAQRMEFFCPTHLGLGVYEAPHPTKA